MPIMNLPGPNAKALIERDHAVVSPSYPRGYPFVMDRGRGVEVWDVDGNRFLDFAAGIEVELFPDLNHSPASAIRREYAC